jgi:TusA-related sulfurtransferase
MYNGMIAPLAPYGMRGVIWYQGEANQGQGSNIYQYKMYALMRGWRQKWGRGDFPFYFVQLPSYHYSEGREMIRESQLKALSETNSGMSVAIDIGEYDSNHPSNKFDTGRRLARWTLVKDLHYDLAYSGPLYRNALIEGSQIRVLFDYAEKGLMAAVKNSTNAVVANNNPMQDFEIAGSNKVFVSATATIDRDTVVVSSPGITNPVYVRYCYTGTVFGSNRLFNVDGFPASPFRTDESYKLDVISGSGGTASNLAVGATVSITATNPASGKVFDRWIGAASEINNLNSATATVTMPHRSLYLLATYRDSAAPIYTLTVNNGFGDGTSQVGSILNIEADAPPTGQRFDHWTGNTQNVVNVHASCTTLRMPASNIAVTAVYSAEDSVGDGVLDSWRALYFGGSGTTTNSDSAANADPDGDGMSNFQEYKAGTSPDDAQSVLRLGSIISGSDMTINFPTVGGRRYRLEMTDSLTTPAWETVLYNIVGDGKQKYNQFDLGAFSKGFCRLRLITE